MAIVLNTKLERGFGPQATDLLELTAEERAKSRHPFTTQGGLDVYVQLDRGTVLKYGDRLQSEDGQLVVEVIAREEPLLAVSSDNPLKLLQAAYHLGNRHVPLEIERNHLYLQVDLVLREMLEQLGLDVHEAQRSFYPETGAYGDHH